MGKPVDVLQCPLNRATNAPRHCACPGNSRFHLVPGSATEGNRLDGGRWASVSLLIGFIPVGKQCTPRTFASDSAISGENSRRSREPTSASTRVPAPPVFDELQHHASGMKQHASLPVQQISNDSGSVTGRRRRQKPDPSPTDDQDRISRLHCSKRLGECPAEVQQQDAPAIGPYLAPLGSRTIMSLSARPDNDQSEYVLPDRPGLVQGCFPLQPRWRRCC